MHEHDQHVSPIKNWKQLVVIVALAFVVPITLIVLLSQLVTSGEKGSGDSESAILARIKPVGEVKLAGATGPRGQLTGGEVFGQVCKTCHENGLAGAPTFGDKAAWGKVIAQGDKVTLQHALSGIRAMPAKGGNPDLEDVEVQRAVVYMANKAGANWKEPPAPGLAGAAASAPGLAPATAVVVAAASVAAPKPDGKKVYEAVCSVCHAAGIAGAPKFGDKTAWAPRLKTGGDALHASALKGKGAMPAKGGNTALSNADVQAAVDYMAAAAR